ncbi:MAG TPA: hypothetical protein VHX60_09265 [Acidobacteriaceae bacterium]|jgi:tetratricopeptide (TPR) repeat protein|nr:hypothetical protein [Acidobacteriaceae bacterium]
MNTLLPGRPTLQQSGRKLASWKAIAEYFDCDVRTAKRWEHERGLPVHRVPGGKRSGVYAWSSELDSWLRSGEQDAHQPPGEVTSAPGGSRYPLLVAVEHSMAVGNEGVLTPSPGLPGESLPPRHRFGWAALCALTFLGIATALYLHKSLNPPAPESLGSGLPATEPQHVPAPGAEDLYLRGRYYWNLRTADSLSRAIDAYTKAIQKDPSYAEAYAGLAESYELLPQFAHANLADAFAHAEAAADQAIRLDPSLAAAHRAKGFALFFWDWNIEQSDSEFRRALALDPNTAETHHWYASTLLNRLEGDASLKQIDEALRLNPTSAAISTDAALIHADFGDDLSASLNRLRELEQTQPALLTPSYFLGAIDFAQGNDPAYLAELRHIASITRNPDDVALADAASRGWTHGGKSGMLQELIGVQKSAFQRGAETGFVLGQYYVLLGRPREGLPYFRAALDHHFILLMTMQDCDWAKTLSTDPGYAALFTNIRERMHGGATAHPREVPLTFRLPLPLHASIRAAN